MKHILYISPSSELGGAERSLLDILRVMKKSPQHKLAVLLLEHGPLEKNIAQLGLGIKICQIPPGLSNFGDSSSRLTKLLFPIYALLQCKKIWRFVQALMSAIHCERYDIIHTNGNKAHIIAALLKPNGCQLIWHLREFLRPNSLSSKILKHLSKKCDVVVSNSKSVSEEAQIVLTSREFKVVYNATENTQQFISPTKQKTFALVATYANWKGHFLFLNAIHHLSETAKSKQLKFKIIGGPIYKTKNSQLNRTQLEEYANKLGIKKYVEFIDFQEHIANIYDEVDIVVNASTEPEPFGRTIIEAMLNSKIVIAPNCGGPKEILGNDQYGFLFEAKSSEDLAKIIEKVAHLDNTENLAKKAYHYAANNFSYDNLQTNLNDLYQLENMARTAARSA